MDTNVFEIPDDFYEDLDETRTIDDDEMSNEEIDGEFLPDVKVTQIKTDMGFKTLMESFERNLYVIPPYQRKYVWSLDKAEELARSLVMGYPIPPIYVYRNEYQQLLVLDGQQRLVSLYLYYKGLWFAKKSEAKKHLAVDELLNQISTGNSEAITLMEAFENHDYSLMTSEVTEQNNRNSTEITTKGTKINYSVLSEKTKRVIDFTILTIIDISINTKRGFSDEAKKSRTLYKIFKNLNSGNEPLTNQEIRNGAYQCKFYEQLNLFNIKNEDWRYYRRSPENSSSDVEWLLRFCASAEYLIIKEFDNKNGKAVIDVSKYKNNYTKFLNDFSDLVIGFDSKQTNKYMNNLASFFAKLKEFQIKKADVTNVILECLFYTYMNFDKFNSINYNKFNRMNFYVDTNILEKIRKTLYTATKRKDGTTIGNARSANAKMLKERLEYVYREISEYTKQNC